MRTSTDSDPILGEPISTSLKVRVTTNSKRKPACTNGKRLSPPEPPNTTENSVSSPHSVNKLGDNHQPVNKKRKGNRRKGNLYNSKQEERSPEHRQLQEVGRLLRPRENNRKSSEIQADLPFTCGICSSAYLSGEELHLHFKRSRCALASLSLLSGSGESTVHTDSAQEETTTEDVNYKCGFCNMKFPDCSFLELHMSNGCPGPSENTEGQKQLSTAVPGSMECGLCQLKLSSEKEIVLHFKLKHSGIQINDNHNEDLLSYLCGNCRGIFRGSKTLVNHLDNCFRESLMKRDHFDMLASENLTLSEYPCGLCSCLFDSSKSLVNHFSTEHSYDLDTRETCVDVNTEINTDLLAAKNHAMGDNHLDEYACNEQEHKNVDTVEMCEEQIDTVNDIEQVDEKNFTADNLSTSLNTQENEIDSDRKDNMAGILTNSRPNDDEQYRSDLPTTDSRNILDTEIYPHTNKSTILQGHENMPPYHSHMADILTNRRPNNDEQYRSDLPPTYARKIEIDTDIYPHIYKSSIPLDNGNRPPNNSQILPVLGTSSALPVYTRCQNPTLSQYDAPKSRDPISIARATCFSVVMNSQENAMIGKHVKVGDLADMKQEIECPQEQDNEIESVPSSLLLRFMQFVQCEGCFNVTRLTFDEHCTFCSKPIVVRQRRMMCICSHLYFTSLDVLTSHLRTCETLKAAVTNQKCLTLLYSEVNGMHKIVEVGDRVTLQKDFSNKKSLYQLDSNLKGNGKDNNPDEIYTEAKETSSFDEKTQRQNSHTALSKADDKVIIVQSKEQKDTNTFIGLSKNDDDDDDSSCSVIPKHDRKWEYRNQKDDTVKLSGADNIQVNDISSFSDNTIEDDESDSLESDASGFEEICIEEKDNEDNFKGICNYEDLNIRTSMKNLPKRKDIKIDILDEIKFDVNLKKGNVFSCKVVLEQMPPSKIKKYFHNNEKLDPNRFLNKPRESLSRTVKSGKTVIEQKTVVEPILKKNKELNLTETLDAPRHKLHKKVKLQEKQEVQETIVRAARNKIETKQGKSMSKDKTCDENSDFDSATDNHSNKVISNGPTCQMLAMSLQRKEENIKHDPLSSVPLASNGQSDEDELLVCEHCSKQFNSMCELEKHSKSHFTMKSLKNAEEFLCGICQAKFGRVKEIEVHMLTHLDSVTAQKTSTVASPENTETADVSSNKSDGRSAKKDSLLSKLIGYKPKINL